MKQLGLGAEKSSYAACQRCWRPSASIPPRRRRRRVYGRAVAAARLGMTDLAAADLAKARALSKTVEGDYAKLGLKP